MICAEETAYPTYLLVVDIDKEHVLYFHTWRTKLTCLIFNYFCPLQISFCGKRLYACPPSKQLYLMRNLHTPDAFPKLFICFASRTLSLSCCCSQTSEYYICTSHTEAPIPLNFPNQSISWFFELRMIFRTASATLGGKVLLTFCTSHQPLFWSTSSSTF